LSCSKIIKVFSWHLGLIQTPGTYRVFCGPMTGQYLRRLKVKRLKLDVTL
jgi:hypothetical protein